MENVKGRETLCLSLLRSFVRDGDADKCGLLKENEEMVNLSSGIFFYFIFTLFI